jgi:hypothetical protein
MQQPHSPEKIACMIVGFQSSAHHPVLMLMHKLEDGKRETAKKRKAACIPILMHDQHTHIHMQEHMSRTLAA